MNCQDSIVIPVTTRPKPVAAFTYTSFFCPAGQVAFQDQSTGTGAAIVEREWIFMPGSTSSLINPTFIFPVTDTTYIVTLIVTDSYGCMDTVSDSVYVKPGFAFANRIDRKYRADLTHPSAFIPHPSPRTVTTICRCRGLTSHSRWKICCQVPRRGFPSFTGTVREGPRVVAWR